MRVSTNTARLVATGALIMLSSFMTLLPAISQSSCTAYNEEGGTCSISCAEGQAATCYNASGANAPLCSCQSNSISKRLHKADQFIPLVFRLESASSKFLNSDPVQTLNVPDSVNAKLAGLSNHHLRDDCVWVEDPPHERPDTGHFGGGGGPNHGGMAVNSIVTYSAPSSGHTVCHPVYGKLTVILPLIVISGPTGTLHEPDWNHIPSDVSIERFSNRNCTPLPQIETLRHSVTETEGYSISNTRTLETGSSNTVSLNGSFKIGIVGFGGSDSITVNSRSSISDTNTQNQTIQHTEDNAFNLQYAAMNLTEGTHTVSQYHVPVPFDGTITVDGGVTPNLDGITRLSQLLPSEADRTFSFAGRRTGRGAVSGTGSPGKKASSRWSPTGRG